MGGSSPSPCAKTEGRTNWPSTPGLTTPWMEVRALPFGPQTCQAHRPLLRLSPRGARRPAPYTHQTVWVRLPGDLRKGATRSTVEHSTLNRPKHRRRHSGPSSILVSQSRLPRNTRHPYRGRALLRDNAGASPAWDAASTPLFCVLRHGGWTQRACRGPAAIPGLQGLYGQKAGQPVLTRSLKRGSSPRQPTGQCGFIAMGVQVPPRPHRP